MIAKKYASSPDLDLERPSAEEVVDAGDLEMAEEELLGHARVIIGAVGQEAAAEALGRSQSSVSRSLTADRRRRLKAGHHLRLTDVVWLLEMAKRLGYTDLVRWIVGVGVENVSAEEAARAWEQVIDQHLGSELAAGMRSAWRKKVLANRMGDDG